MKQSVKVTATEARDNSRRDITYPVFLIYNGNYPEERGKWGVLFSSATAGMVFVFDKTSARRTGTYSDQWTPATDTDTWVEPSGKIVIEIQNARDN